MRDPVSEILDSSQEKGNKIHILEEEKKRRKERRKGRREGERKNAEHRSITEKNFVDNSTEVRRKELQN